MRQFLITVGDPGRYEVWCECRESELKANLEACAEAYREQLGEIQVWELTKVSVSAAAFTIHDLDSIRMHDHDTGSCP